MLKHIAFLAHSKIYETAMQYNRIYIFQCLILKTCSSVHIIGKKILLTKLLFLTRRTSISDKRKWYTNRIFNNVIGLLQKTKRESMDDNPLGTFLHINKDGKIIFDIIVLATDLGCLIGNFDCGYSTLWKISNFPTTLILRKIKFGWFQKVKHYRLNNFERIFGQISVWKCQKFPKIQTSELLKLWKWQFLGLPNDQKEFHVKYERHHVFPIRLPRSVNCHVMSINIHSGTIIA